MQDLTRQIVDNAVLTSVVLAAAGVVAGYLGTVVPTTFLFMASGLVLMMKSGRRDVGPAE
jgi:hypothetical protein